MKPMPSNIPDLIYEALQLEIDKILEVESKEAAKRVEKQVRELTTKIAANVLRRFSFEMHHEELLIRVDFKNTSEE